MKNVKTAIVFIAAISALIFIREADAQSVIIMTDNGQIVDCTQDTPFTNDGVKNVNTITEADYPYLKNIECLRNGYFSNHQNLNLQLRDVNRGDNENFVLEGSGATIDVKAVYDEQGNLLEATMIKKDTQVPIPILRFIYSHEKFSDWTMTGNEIIVKDFDPYQTDYKVMMTNGIDTEVLHFKEQGESIAYQN
ncbi:MAG: hypothetical protein GVY20_14360 [Bacteroidetes bacterium]|jgi:hypothetical protein|nr:hypothetical protein [Bacteroidota bacterium]